METFESLKSTIKLLREELALEKSRNIVNTSVLEGSNLIVWSVNMDFELISFNQNYFRELFSDEKNSKIKRKTTFLREFLGFFGFCGGPED